MTPTPENSCLNVQVSCVKNYFSKKSVPVNLLTWLRTEKYRPAVERIRQENDKATRGRLKANIPAITPSGLFHYVKAEALQKHSGFIQFDIDLKDNLHLAKYDTLHRQLRNIANVAYCGRSVSGTGYWGLVRVGYPDKHVEHWEYLHFAMKRYGINIDPLPKSICSLRGASYDPDAYYNHQAVKLFHYVNPVVPQDPGNTPNMTVAVKRIEHAVQQLEHRRIDITATYRSWFAIGCNLAATFGEYGREIYHRVSSFHPNYSTRDCDYQYTQCMRHVSQVKTPPGLNYFYRCCKDEGIKTA